MVPIANRMVHLDRKGQRPYAAGIGEPSHGKYGEKIVPLAGDIDIKGGEGEPWHH